MTPDPRLLDVCCYYYEPVKLPLLREAVLPATADARDLGVEAHVERHWLFGPHLRVRLAGESQAVLAPVAQQVAQRLRGYVAAHPSAVEIDESALLAQAQLAGREELVPPPYTPFRPDNSVEIEPVDTTPLSTLLGSPAAVAVRMRAMRAGVAALAESAAALRGRERTGGARVQLALTAMALHAGRYRPGFAGGYQSFLSHLKEFLLHHDRAGKLASVYEATWQRRADQVTPLVARLSQADARTGMERAWLEWTLAAREIAAPAYQRGELQRVPGYSYTDRAERFGDSDIALRWNPDQRTEFSDYHQLLRQTDLDNFPYIEEFVPYRFATSVLYLLLTVLDVQPLERYLAAHLLSQAAERIIGVTWRERLEQRIASQRAAAATRPVAP